MIVHVNIQREAVPILQQMAKEAGIGLRDIVEISAYNLIACYQKDRGIGQQPLDTDQPVAPDLKLGLP